MADASTADVYLVTYWHRDIADSASRAFVGAFERAVGRPPRHGDAVYYDAVMLAATAVREAGANREDIRQWLGELGTTRPAYDGIAGPISFAPNRSRALLMTQIRGDATVMVGSP